MWMILIRHGESVANARGVVEGGDGNSVLTWVGIDQAEKAAAFLARELNDVRAVFSSTQRRARATARPIAEQFSLPIVEQAGLIEGRLGGWEGRTLREIDWSILEADPNFRGHGGESPRDLARRGADALESIRATHPTGTVIVVSHGATISHGLAMLLETEPVIGTQYGSSNTGMTYLDWAAAPRIVMSNSVRHLGKEVDR